MQISGDIESQADRRASSKTLMQEYSWCIQGNQGDYTRKQNWEE